MFTSIQSRLSSTLRPSRVNRMGKGVLYAGLAALMTLSAATAQVAALDATGLDDSGNAKSEMAACNSGKTQQDRAACRKEVHNANAEKRAGQLGNGADYTANALKRCEVFKGNDDQAACRARIESQARIDGSVAGGGVLRETETVVPAK